MTYILSKKLERRFSGTTGERLPDDERTSIDCNLSYFDSHQVCVWVPKDRSDEIAEKIVDFLNSVSE